MEGFKTPTTKRFRPKLDTNSEFQTPVKIPPSPFLQQIGYGCGVNVFTLERSPRVGRMRSPWAVKKRNNKVSKDKKYNERIRYEAEILKKLTHPNIVGFRAFTISPTGDPCLVMEQLDISLGDLIEERQTDDAGPFAAKSILKVAHEVAKGLEYLHHTAKILHGDMKSYNILVSKSLESVKICDFGVSVPLTETLHMDTSNSEVTYTGTKCWNAPEVIFECGPITNKTDIWAYGLVIWEMIALSPPHAQDIDEMENEPMESSMNDSMLYLCEPYTAGVKENSNPNDATDENLSILDETDNGTYGTRPPLPAIHISPAYDRVLEVFIACTDSDYISRPSAKGLVNFFHEYMKSTTSKSGKSTTSKSGKSTKAES